MMTDMYSVMYNVDMSQRYSIADARTNLPAIVDAAETGQAIELTRHGRPVAVVVSVRDFERLRDDRPRFGARYKTFLETHSLKSVGLDADFAASLRDKGAGRKVTV